MCPATSIDRGVPETTAEAVAVGGRTPPLTKTRLLAGNAASFQNTAAEILGQFTILDEGICIDGNSDCIDYIVPTLPGWGLMVMTLLSLIAGTIVFGRHDRRAAVG